MFFYCVQQSLKPNVCSFNILNISSIRIGPSLTNEQLRAYLMSAAIREESIVAVIIQLIDERT